MSRIFILPARAASLAILIALGGCGYHAVGAATHLPPDVTTLSVPMFATRNVYNGMDTAMTEAVIRELNTRTRLRVTAKTDENSDAVLHGTILKESITPLTYNTATQQSSSYLITVTVSVTVNARGGKVLYQNPNYVYRQQYQATTNLPTFLEEDPAAVQRLSQDFARQLVADVLESF